MPSVAPFFSRQPKHLEKFISLVCNRVTSMVVLLSPNEICFLGGRWLGHWASCGLAPEICMKGAEPAMSKASGVCAGEAILLSFRDLTVFMAKLHTVDVLWI